MEQDRKPEINLCTYGQLVYDKGPKITKCWKVSPTNGAEKTGQVNY